MLPSQRALFEIPRQICYLNAASYSPLPLKTLEAGRAAVGRKGTPWTLEAGFANAQHERARTAAARLMLDAGVGLLRTLPAAEPDAVEALRAVARGLGVDWPAATTPAALLAGLPRDSPTARGRRYIAPMSGT